MKHTFTRLDGVTTITLLTVGPPSGLCRYRECDGDRGGTPLDMRGGTPLDMRGGTPLDMRGGAPLDMRGGTPLDMRGGTP